MERMNLNTSKQPSWMRRHWSHSRWSIWARSLRQLDRSWKNFRGSSLRELMGAMFCHWVSATVSVRKCLEDIYIYIVKYCKVIFFWCTCVMFLYYNVPSIAWKTSNGTVLGHPLFECFVLFEASRRELGSAAPSASAPEDKRVEMNHMAVGHNPFGDGKYPPFHNHSHFERLKLGVHRGSGVLNHGHNISNPRLEF